MDPSALFAGLTLAVAAATYYSIQRSNRKRSDQNIEKSITKEAEKLERGLPKSGKADYLWIGQRGFLGLAAASKVIRAERDSSRVAGLVRARINEMWLAEFVEDCGLELGRPNQDSRAKHRYLWPLAEFLEEAVDLGLTKNKDEIFYKVVELLVPEEGDLDYDRIWAIGRACQEIQERNPCDSTKTKLIQQIGRRIAKHRDESAKAIFNYCLKAEEFEEVKDKDDGTSSLENLLTATLELPMHLFKETARLEWIRCCLDGWTLLQNGSIVSITAWTDKVMKDFVGTTPRWTAVSFLRLSLQYLQQHHADKLEPVAVHLLKNVERSDCSVFQLVEVFEPVFFDLVFSGKGEQVLANDFVDAVKTRLTSGCDDSNAPEHLIEFCYGVATCLAELAEKGRFKKKSYAVRLFKTELLSDVPHSPARRNLLEEWLESRVLRYRKVLEIE